ncbi:hypothetical protein ABPG77_003554 [Micractinium sp. CCAP 211/92]
MSFFSHLPGVEAASFGEGSPSRARYMSLVLAKSRTFQAKPGVPKDPAVVLVSATPTGRTLVVYTRVYFPPGQNVAAQGMWSNLLVPPGEKAPWLQAAWPGTELTNVKCVVACNDTLCETCVNSATGAATRRVCSKCVDKTGVPGQPGYATVYMKNDAQHTCALCTVPLCVRCGPQGTCVTCAAGFTLREGQCRAARAASAAAPVTGAVDKVPAPAAPPQAGRPPAGPKPGLPAINN